MQEAIQEYTRTADRVDNKPMLFFLFVVDATVVTSHSIVVSSRPRTRKAFCTAESLNVECDGLCTRWFTALHDERIAHTPQLIEYRDSKQFVYNSLEMHDVVVDFGALRRTSSKSSTDEESEYFSFSTSAFYLPNSTITSRAAVKASYLVDQVWSAIDRTGIQPACGDILDISEHVVFVKRYEYANVWHQYTDWFNAMVAELLLRLDDDDSDLKRHRRSVAFELFDLHGETPLDDLWKFVFPGMPMLGVSELVTSRRCVRYRRLAFAAIGYHSRVSQFPDRVQEHVCADLHARLRVRVLRGLNVRPPTRHHVSQCVIIARRDYVAHPRNPLGVVKRKWANESAPLAAALAAGWSSCVLVDLASKTLREQIGMMVATSLLIAVHGAALTLLAFTPQHARILEVGTEQQPHFAQLAKHVARRYVRVQAHGDEWVSFVQQEMIEALQSLHAV